MPKPDSRRDWSDLDFVEHDATNRAEATAASLKITAQWIADKMRRLIERLDADDWGGVNSLGELQGHAVELDRLCAELRLREEHVIAMRRLQERQS